MPGAAAHPPVGCAIVVEEVRHHRLARPVHRRVELPPPVVVVVVCYEREVEKRRELGRPSVNEVYREHGLRRLDYVAHVVDAPHGWAGVRHDSIPRLLHHLLERGVQLDERGQAPRIAVAPVFRIEFGGGEVGLGLPELENRVLVARQRLRLRHSAAARCQRRRERRRGRCGLDELQSAVFHVVVS